MTQNNLLAYPDFKKIFDIHTDAIDFQLGAFSTQEAKQIDFHREKLTGHQKL